MLLNHLIIFHSESWVRRDIYTDQAHGTHKGSYTKRGLGSQPQGFGPRVGIWAHKGSSSI